jgi:asparagine synthase (glutamine-hydrolysing)
MYLWTRSVFPQMHLNHWGDRMEMAHSVEGRTPFLDHRLVECVSRMPERVKIRDLTEKYVLREAVRPYITETAYRRHQHLFTAPPVAERGRFPGMIADLIHSRALDSLPFFDAERVRAAWSELAALPDAARNQRSRLLMQIASFCALQQRYSP